MHINLKELYCIMLSDDCKATVTTQNQDRAVIEVTWDGEWKPTRYQFKKQTGNLWEQSGLRWKRMLSVNRDTPYYTTTSEPT